MLASSCCVVQLVLNALSVGCAGFAVLTPYRLPFTGVALGLLIASSRKSVWTPATTAMAGLSVALMASPDLVDSYNNGRLSDWTAPLFGSAVVDRPRQGCVPVVTQTLTFEIKGLRCMGCASRVKSVLEALPTVTDARVYFDAGAAVISRTVPAYLVSDKASVSPEVSADTAVFAKAVRESLARIDFQYRAKLVATEHTKPECA
ncbi:hypothetical protein HK105_204068 [Polyrhizophydium stewartii]|uniref:HMA domain-containing protein n=1 Tax=Polyrhizophydium stewartii TaxID=2732419 RepID=A0ABR4N9V6_9FUNG